MQPREKILAAIVGGLLVVLVIFYGYGKLSAALEARRASVAALELEVAKKEVQIEAGREAALRLAEWEERSLPADVEQARTLYQNWLVTLIDDVKLRNARIEPGRESTKRDAFSKQVIYHVLPFTVQGRGTLQQAVQLLHDFYSAGHLHLLRSVSFKPIAGSKDLDLELTIEAMSLPGAAHKKLTTQPGTHDVGADSKPYVQAIVERNLFAEYMPPPPPAPKPIARPTPPPPPAFNTAKYAVLTAVVQVGDKSQAWFSLRTSGEVLKLAEGDPVDVGAFHGTLKRIGVKDVEIDTEEGEHRVSIGESLQ